MANQAEEDALKELDDRKANPTAFLPTVTDVITNVAAKYALVIEIHHSGYGPGLQQIDVPIHNPGTCQMLSLMLLIADLAKESGAPMVIEQLVHSDQMGIFDRNESGGKYSQETLRAARRRVVVADRYHFLFNEFTAPVASDIIAERMASTDESHATRQPATKRRRKSAQTATPVPERSYYEVSKDAITNISQLGAALKQYTFSMGSDRGRQITFALDTETDESEEGAATSEAEPGMYPPSHAFASLHHSTLNNDDSQRRYASWGIPESQRKTYVNGAGQWIPPSDATHLMTFIKSDMHLETWPSVACAGQNPDLSMRIMRVEEDHDARGVECPDLWGLTKDEFDELHSNGALREPGFGGRPLMVPADQKVPQRVDDHHSASVFNNAYKAVGPAQAAIRALRPYDISTGQFDRFLDTVRATRKQLFRSAVIGTPSCYSIAFKDHQRIEREACQADTRFGRILRGLITGTSEKQRAGFSDMGSHMLFRFEEMARQLRLCEDQIPTFLMYLCGVLTLGHYKFGPQLLMIAMAKHEKGKSYTVEAIKNILPPALIANSGSMSDKAMNEHSHGLFKPSDDVIAERTTGFQKNEAVQREIISESKHAYTKNVAIKTGPNQGDWAVKHFEYWHRDVHVKLSNHSLSAPFLSRAVVITGAAGRQIASNGMTMLDQMCAATDQDLHNAVSNALRHMVTGAFEFKEAHLLDPSVENTLCWPLVTTIAKAELGRRCTLSPRLTANVKSIALGFMWGRMEQTWSKLQEEQYTHRVRTPIGTYRDVVSSSMLTDKECFMQTQCILSPLDALRTIFWVQQTADNTHLVAYLAGAMISMIVYSGDDKYGETDPQDTAYYLTRLDQNKQEKEVAELHRLIQHTGTSEGYTEVLWNDLKNEIDDASGKQVISFGARNGKQTRTILKTYAHAIRNATIHELAMWRFFLDVMAHRPDLYRFDAAEGFEGNEGLTVVFKLPVTRYITAPANVDEEQFMSPSDPAFMAAKSILLTPSLSRYGHEDAITLERVLAIMETRGSITMNCTKQVDNCFAALACNVTFIGDATMTIYVRAGEEIGGWVHEYFPDVAMETIMISMGDTWEVLDPLLVIDDCIATLMGATPELSIPMEALTAKPPRHFRDYCLSTDGSPVEKRFGGKVFYKKVRALGCTAIPMCAIELARGIVDRIDSPRHEMCAEERNLIDIVAALDGTIEIGEKIAISVGINGLEEHVVGPRLEPDKLYPNPSRIDNRGGAGSPQPTVDGDLETYTERLLPKDVKRVAIANGIYCELHKEHFREITGADMPERFNPKSTSRPGIPYDLEIIDIVGGRRRASVHRSVEIMQTCSISDSLCRHFDCKPDGVFGFDEDGTVHNMGTDVIPAGYSGALRIERSD